MKKGYKIFSAVLAIVLLCVVAVGCASSKYSENQSTSMAAPAAAPEAPAPAPEISYSSQMDTKGKSEAGYGMGGTDVGKISVQDQKIIFNAYLELETKNFEDVLDSIAAKVAALGGYTESSNVSGRKPEKWNDPGRYASITVRIPADKLDEFLAQAKSFADVLSENKSSDNVTQQYYDSQSRKKTLEIQLERLENILTKSEKLEDILALETEIARIRYEIESLTTNLRNWDNYVAYSTATLNIQELTSFDTPGAQQQTFGERLLQAAQKAAIGTGEALQNFAIWIINAIPTLVILAIIGVIVWLIVRGIRKARAKRIHKRQDNHAPLKSASETIEDNKKKD